MDNNFLEYVQNELALLTASGLYRYEWELSSPQQTHILLNDGKKLLNLSSNNYLGLANHPAILEAAKNSCEKFGFGMASVRFISGTQTIHKQLESKLSQFLGMEDTLLYGSCFDANGGLFETFLGEEDAVISDSLNHASIIDGIRLCKAKRYRYSHNDMQELENQLKQTSSSRFRIIATDGVFSMDGQIANLKSICDLADRYKALVMVDDCHGTGILGERGRGTPEYCGVLGRIDILTGTLGKALGGASGGYISAKKEIVELLRQLSRPYLFSNSLAPSLVAGAIKALDIVTAEPELRKQLHANAVFFREELLKLDLNVPPGEHPIIPILIGEDLAAKAFAKTLLAEGVYAVAFSYPVVPHGTARIRAQVSSAHTREDLEFALEAFKKVQQAVK